MPTPRTPEAGVPFLEQLKRMLPSMLGGYQGDQRLPMQAGSGRDPRLPQGNQFDMLRDSLDQVRSLGAPAGDPATAALEAMKRQR